MKKFLAMMLAVLMLLSMATVAMASEDTSKIDHGNWNITNIANGGEFNLEKVYTNGEYAPDETFHFQITPEANGDPLPTITTEPSNESGVLSSTITVKLPTYSKVGTYIYTMTETAGSTKGVSYDTINRTLKVYVENDGNGGFKCQVALIKENGKKDDRFTNVYNQGTLLVKKTVQTDVAADKDIDYSITVKLTGVNSVSYTGVITKKQGSEPATANVTFTGNNGVAEATFSLKDAEYLTIEHLPQGAKYEVSEANAMPDASHIGEWTVSGLVTADDDETIAAGDNTVEVTNNFAYKGDLVVNKVVTGNLGDEGKWFTFTVTGYPADCDVVPSDNDKYEFVSSENGYTFRLQHGGQVTFKNIPYGTTCNVTEDADGYDSTKVVAQYFVKGNEYKLDESASTTDNGTMDHAKEVVTFTNENQQNIETGVSLDTLPYVLVLALAGAGLVMMIARKRRVQD